MVGFPNNSMGFPTKNDHFGVEIGGTRNLRKHPYRDYFIDHEIRIQVIKHIIPCRPHLQDSASYVNIFGSMTNICQGK